MKKLKKLQINTEKLMKKEELLRLRGGYEDCHCICYSRGPLEQPVGAMAATNESECDEMCDLIDCDGNWNCGPIW